MNNRTLEQQGKGPLEQALEAYYSAPAPRAEFLASLEGKLIAKPRPAQRLSFRPAYAFLAVVLLLLAALLGLGPSRVLAAIQGWVGYLPGFGLVEEDAPLRTLAEPVAQTREGVTVTVKQAVLSPERTSITYTVQGLPPEALPLWTVDEQGRICTPVSELRLVDGTSLQQTGAGGGYLGGVYQRNAFFPPLPAEVNGATWALDCLPQTLTGKAPEDWEIPLAFAPAPPDLALLPVEMITPTPSVQPSPAVASTPAVTAVPAATGTLAPTQTAEPTPTAADALPTGENPLFLDQVVETEDGYIFIGRFRQVLPAQVVGILPEIRDANGVLQGYTIPGDIQTSGVITHAIEWAYQIHKKEIAWPIIIRFTDVQAHYETPRGLFTFDAGADPQEGQVWEIDQDFRIGPYTVHLDSIQCVTRSGKPGYLIRTRGMAGNSVDLLPVIEDTTVYETFVRWNEKPARADMTLVYEELPKGRLKLSFYASAPLRGPWQVQWQPRLLPGQ